MAVDRDRIREIYLARYAETRDSADAWNAVIERLSPLPADPSEEESRTRREVADALAEMQDALLLEAGDPLALAVEEAMTRLRAADVVREARDFWRRVLEDVRASRRPGKRRQDWAPDAEREAREAAEKMEDIPHLHVYFDEEGGMEGYKFEWADYETRRAAAVASVPLSEEIDYDEIEREIGEALARARDDGDIEFKEDER